MTDQTKHVLEQFSALPAEERFEALQLMKLLHEMAPKSVAPPEPKKRGRPEGSKNRRARQSAATVTQLLDGASA